MGDVDKVYPVIGFVDIGMYRLRVKLFSEKDEQKTRQAAQAIKVRLKELASGYDDPINECAAMLLLELMMENTELKSRAEYSVDHTTLQNINELLESVDDFDKK